MELLVQRRDVDINFRMNCGSSALHLVCISGDLEICRLLLRNGADIQAKTSDGGTVLHAAVFSCNANVAELLINQGEIK